MFAPKVPKAQAKTKTAEDPVGTPEFRRSPPARSSGASASQRGSARDFSKIPIYPAPQADESQPSFRRTSVLPLSGMRPRLAVGRIDDPLEHGADHIADRVMGKAATETSIAAVPVQVSRKCAACEGEEEKALRVSTKPAVAASHEAPRIVHEALSERGAPLAGSTRSFFEPRLGFDLSHVRIHAGGLAAASAAAIGARGYAAGRHIVFGTGQYEPETPAGRRLLAHELAHVMQPHDRPFVQRSVGTGTALGLLGGGVAAGLLIGGLAAGPIGALIGSLVGAAIVGGGLLAEHLFSGKSQADKTKSDLLADPKTRAIFEAKLREGLAVLHANKKGCDFPSTKPGRYDEDRWKEEGKPREATEVQYRYKGASAAAGVDDLFAHLDRWECDCAMYTEIATLYAVRHTLGAAEFNRRFPDMRIRRHESIGVPRETTSAPVEDPDPRAAERNAKERAAFDKFWVDSPVGTKVSWHNNSPRAQPSWEFEHAIKVVKGSSPTGAGDRYDAHPISQERHAEGKSTELTEYEVKLAMVLHANDAPTKFAPTLETWKVLQGEGISADIIQVAQSANIAQFRTHDTLVKGVIAAFKASPQKVSIDGPTMTKLVNTLITSSERDDPSLKAERDAYIRDNIVRHNVSRLRL